MSNVVQKLADAMQIASEVLISGVQDEECIFIDKVSLFMKEKCLLNVFFLSGWCVSTEK